MINWLLSRPLQLKFFASSVLLFSIGMLLIVFSVFQVLDQFLTHYTEQDMQHRSQILASAMMAGSAAQNPKELQALLQDVSAMHGYCYLEVLDNSGNMLASVGGNAPESLPAEDELLLHERNLCLGATLPLYRDGRPFGNLHYGVDTNFIDALQINLRARFLIIGWLWFLGGSALYFFLVRRLVRPLKVITQASVSMAQGNLNSAMPAGLPQDELGKLALSFSQMATTLRTRIESQHQYAHALYAEQARLNALISILPVGIFFVDSARRIQFINMACRNLWALSDSVDYIGWSDRELMEFAPQLLEQSDVFLQNIEAVLRTTGISAPFDTTLRNGRIIRSRSCAVPDATRDRFIGRIWMFEDVTQEYTRLLKAQSYADRDVLTGLYNHRRFQLDLEHHYTQAHQAGACLSLLYFDVDDFQRIHRDFGHIAGDQILNGVAQALSAQTRHNEHLYRAGGETFAILAFYTDEQLLSAFAQRIIATVSALSFNFADHPVRISCSIGIATCSPGASPEDAEAMLRQADIAMCQAKQLGKNRWQYYTPGPAGTLDKDSR